MFILQRESDLAAEAFLMPMQNKKELRVLTVYAGKKRRPCDAQINHGC